MRYGTAALNVWITDSYPLGFSFKDDPAAKPSAPFPADNGTYFRVVEFPPLDRATEASIEPNYIQKAVGDRAPKRGLPGTHPMTHRTRTVDYVVVLSGEIDMVLHDSVVALSLIASWSMFSTALSHAVLVTKLPRGTVPHGTAHIRSSLGHLTRHEHSA